MTALFQSVWTYLSVQSWALILVLGLLGLGGLALRCLIGRPPSLALALSVGISGAIFLGGLLNLLHLITREVLLGFILTGVALWLGQVLSRRPLSRSGEFAVLFSGSGPWNWRHLAVLAFILFALFRWAGLPRMVAYDHWDDEPFYLAVPVKMLETHHLAADPYSERRIESSVGGCYFLQGLVLAALPLRNVHLADQHLGFALLILAALALARTFHLSPFATAFFALFAVAIPVPDHNLTFNVLPSALLLVLVLLAAEEWPGEIRPGLQPFLIGLTGGTLCALKTTYVPQAVLFCLGLLLLWGWRRGWKFAAPGGFIMALGGLTTFLPWMIAQRMTSGTFLFPLLGKGYAFPAYAQYPVFTPLSPGIILGKAAPFLIPLAAILMFQLIVLSRDEKSKPLLLLTACCFISVLVTAFGTGGSGVLRYSFPIFLPVLLALFLHLSRERGLRPDWRPGRVLQMGGALILFLASSFLLVRPDHGLSLMASRISISLTDPPLDSLETREKYARINAALPGDGLVLATVQRPYLLGPLTERIFLADMVGGAGPPGGWPIQSDGEAVAAYLLSHSIRYVAYSHAGNRMLDFSRQVAAEPDPPSAWIRNQTTHYLVVNRQYLQLSKSRKKIYEDGTVFILDLATRVDVPAS